MLHPQSGGVARPFLYAIKNLSQHQPMRRLYPHDGAGGERLIHNQLQVYAGERKNLCGDRGTNAGERRHLHRFRGLYLKPGGRLFHQGTHRGLIGAHAQWFKLKRGKRKQVKAYRKIAYDVQRGSARIVLNRPERRNALDQELLTELRDALRVSGVDKSVRVVVVAGAGQDFCSGMDLRTFADDASGDLEKFRSEARNMAAVLLDMRRHPRPIVAAVQGRALGGGCGIATAADMVLAADSAQFGYPEVNIGFVPAIVIAILRRLVGEKRAFELIASGEAVSAQTALDYGMLNRVFPAAAFEQEVEAFVTNLASKSTSALTLSKELFYRTDGMPLEAALEAGAQVNAFARTTEDFQRGIGKFLKK